MNQRNQKIVKVKEDLFKYLFENLLKYRELVPFLIRFWKHNGNNQFFKKDINKEIQSQFMSAPKIMSGQKTKDSKEKQFSIKIINHKGAMFHLLKLMNLFQKKPKYDADKENLSKEMMTILFKLLKQNTQNKQFNYKNFECHKIILDFCSKFSLQSN